MLYSSIFVLFKSERKWRRYISRSDGDHSLCALKSAVRGAMPDVEMIPKERFVGDHAADGDALWKVNILQPIMPILTWLPRYRIGEDGMTVEQRRTGKRSLKPALVFGERRMWDHHSRTGSILAMTNGDMVKRRGDNRMSLRAVRALLSSKT